MWLRVGCVKKGSFEEVEEFLSLRDCKGSLLHFHASSEIVKVHLVVCWLGFYAFLYLPQRSTARFAACCLPSSFLRFFSRLLSRFLRLLAANHLHFFVASLRSCPAIIILRQATPRRQKICGNDLSRHRPAELDDFIQDEGKRSFLPPESFSSSLSLSTRQYSKLINSFLLRHLSRRGLL